MCLEGDALLAELLTKINIWVFHYESEKKKKQSQRHLLLSAGQLGFDSIYSVLSYQFATFRYGNNPTPAATIPSVDTRCLDY